MLHVVMNGFSPLGFFIHSSVYFSILYIYTYAYLENDG